MTAAALERDSPVAFRAIQTAIAASLEDGGASKMKLKKRIGKSALSSFSS